MTDRLRQLPLELYFLFAGTTVTRLGAFVFPYLTIYLSDGRGFAPDRVGQILSVGSVGLLLGNFSGGWLSDRWSRKRTLIVALVVNAAGFAGLAFGGQPAWSYGTFLFVGYFGSGMYPPAANTLIADLAPPGVRPFAYTVNYVCINLGMALGPLIAGLLAAVAYELIFIGDVVTTLVCAGLIAAGIRGRRQSPSRESSSPGRAESSFQVWRRYPLVLFFCLCNFFLICPLMGLEYSVPLLVRQVFDSQLVYVGLIYTINAACILAFSFVIERLVRDRNEMLVMAVSGLLWTTGLMIVVSNFSIAALVACTAVWTLGEIVASIQVPSFVAARVPAAVKGRFMALIDVTRSLAGVLCPIGLGLLWVRGGPHDVVVLLAALPTAGMILYGGLFVVTGRFGRVKLVPQITGER